jgi:hypothetical protein
LAHGFGLGAVVYGDIGAASAKARAMRLKCVWLRGEPEPDANCGVDRIHFAEMGAVCFPLEGRGN